MHVILVDPLLDLGRARSQSRFMLAKSRAPLWIVLVAILGIVTGVPSFAQTLGTESGLPLPRFASLRFDEVNLRRGPSGDHQITAVYQRKGLPIEILGEYRDWRRVRDYEGDTGWIKRTQLSAERTAIVLDAVAPLRRVPAGDGRVVARLSPGLVLELRSCPDSWCSVRVLGYRGYVLRDALWGLSEAEEYDGG